MNLKDLSDQLHTFVTLDRYTPVEKIVYGFTGVVLMAAAVALVSLIIKK